MKKVLILGAGGHAQVVADILLQANEAGEAINPIGYLDDNPELKGQKLVGLTVLGSISDLSRVNHDGLIIAVGDNLTRKKLFESFYQKNEHFIIARHPKAVVANEVTIGPGTMICAGVVVNTAAEIGANVILNTGSTIDHHSCIGNHVHIAPGVHLGGEVTIGEGAFVGIGAAVLPGKTVGAWCKIGAGAVVNQNIVGGATARGVPAKICDK